MKTVQPTVPLKRNRLACLSDRAAQDLITRSLPEDDAIAFNCAASELLGGSGVAHEVKESVQERYTRLAVKASFDSLKHETGERLIAAFTVGSPALNAAVVDAKGKLWLATVAADGEIGETRCLTTPVCVCQWFRSQSYFASNLVAGEAFADFFQAIAVMVNDHSVCCASSYARGS